MEGFLSHQTAGTGAGGRGSLAWTSRGISPDSRVLAHATELKGRASLWVKIGQSEQQKK